MDKINAKPFFKKCVKCNHAEFYHLKSVDTAHRDQQRWQYKSQITIPSECTECKKSGKSCKSFKEF